jgi:hypothetical protein
VAVDEHDPARTIGIGSVVDDASGKRRAGNQPATRQICAKLRMPSYCGRKSVRQCVIKDSPNFIVSQRVISHREHWVGYLPARHLHASGRLKLRSHWVWATHSGPLALGNAYGPITARFCSMQTVYGDPRYRPARGCVARTIGDLCIKEI